MNIYVSPSQLDTYLTCKRKWAFRYIDGIEAPPHRSAQVGTRVHEILEHWLRDATPPNIEEELTIDGHTYHTGRIAMEAIPFLPPPGPHLRLEEKFINGHWLGYMDVKYRAAPNHAVVMDHKTTGNFGYAKTSEDLATDPQAIIYARAVLDEDPEVQIVDLAWTYTRTVKPYKAHPVRLRVLREYVDEAIRPYDHIAREMLALRTSGLRAMQIEPDPQHCQKYGGCPYLDRCNLTPEELMRGVMNQMSLMDKIAAAKGAIAGAPLPPALPEPIGATAPPPVLPAHAPPLPAPSASPAPPLPAPVPALPSTMAAPPGTSHTTVLPQGSVVHYIPAAPAAAPPPLPAPPVETWLQHPQSAAHEYNPATGELREKAKVAPPSPAPALPAPAPQPLWVTHPENPAYEYNPATNELRAAAPAAPAAAPQLNPPEAPQQERAQPIPVTQNDGDESKVGDEFDAKSPDELKAIAKLNGIEVKGLREKNLRITVRAGMRAKGLGSPPAPAAQPAVAAPPPAPAPAAAPELTALHAAIVAAPQTAPRSSVPRFSVCVDCYPIKTQGIVMTLTEAFGLEVDDTPGTMRAKFAAKGPELSGAVLILRTTTREGAALHDLLLEHALEVFG